MKEIILITGANGSLAKTVKELLSNRYEIRNLTTNKKSVDKKSTFYWDITKKYIDTNALKNCKHIIHLSGYSILKKWTDKNKKLMHESRIGGAKLLFKKCKELNISPTTFISASASGIYGLTAIGLKTEKDEIGLDWVAKMANEWEISAQKFSELGTRVVNMRLSLLLSKNSGFLKYTLLSMKYGIGIITGEKKDPINWIHIDDVASFIKESIQKEQYQGTYNLANQYEISQEKFFKTIKKELFPYSLIIRLPIFCIRLVLGKRSMIINSKITLSVDKLKRSNFVWKYTRLEDVLKN